ncbi:MAG: NAD(P)/FAD-dependent oxidoreductase [Clostridium sp.]|uniref:NAD(P)/FAD-dependent oxidoreductase n=1 Tax=Clostridium sp. TaxID=1506 RepID=UPI002A8E3B03|nr:NAD(P)/FAD-dependent oxidoreductase [Clostridium sp.]MDY5097573.1 NAD(P)/FAD-dependent oxidoreductase [Clostridium sp.]
MSERYDVAIVGSGPAGLSAAINCKIRNKNIILFGNENLSNKVSKAPKINNYLGLPGIKGEDLKEAFKKHIDSMDISITSERINAIYAMGDYFALMVNEKMYEAKSVILATGMEYGKALKGEEEFLGKGVGYCATCDAPLYKGKKVAIIAYNKKEEEEANFVKELADTVYYIPMYKDIENLREDIIVVRENPVEIKGDDVVKSLQLSNTTLEVDGVFVLKDSISPDQLMPGLKITDGHVEVDRQMATNLNGCFAAGDCTGKPYQYIKSSGEGLVAALNAVSYLNNKK